LFYSQHLLVRKYGKQITVESRFSEVMNRSAFLAVLNLILKLQGTIFWGEDFTLFHWTKARQRQRGTISTSRSIVAGTTKVIILSLIIRKNGSHKFLNICRRYYDSILRKRKLVEFDSDTTLESAGSRGEDFKSRVFPHLTSHFSPRSPEHFFRSGVRRFT